MTERQRQFVQYAKALPDRVKTWIVLSYLEGMTDEEIAATLEAGKAEVKWMIDNTIESFKALNPAE